MYVPNSLPLRKEVIEAIKEFFNEDWVYNEPTMVEVGKWEDDHFDDLKSLYYGEEGNGAIKNAALDYAERFGIHPEDL